MYSCMYIYICIYLFIYIMGIGQMNSGKPSSAHMKHLLIVSGMCALKTVKGRKPLPTEVKLLYITRRLNNSVPVFPRKDVQESLLASVKPVERQFTKSTSGPNPPLTPLMTNISHISVLFSCSCKCGDAEGKANGRLVGCEGWQSGSKKTGSEKGSA